MKIKHVVGKSPRIRFRPVLFWDVDPKSIDLRRHAGYIIERVLDFGNDQEVKWMWETYPVSLIRKVVKNSRSLRLESRLLWKAITTIR